MKDATTLVTCAVPHVRCHMRGTTCAVPTSDASKGFRTIRPDVSRRQYVAGCRFCVSFAKRDKTARNTWKRVLTSNSVMLLLDSLREPGGGCCHCDILDPVQPLVLQGRRERVCRALCYVLPSTTKVFFFFLVQTCLNSQYSPEQIRIPRRARRSFFLVVDK